MKLILFSIFIYLIMASVYLESYASLTNANKISENDNYDVIIMNRGEVKRNNPKMKKTVEVYCYPGTRKSVLGLFQTVKFNIDVPSEDFRQYLAGTAEEVYSAYTADSYGWNIMPFRGKQPRSNTLDPFNSTCLAINTKEAHKIELLVIGVDLWRVLALSAGLSLFFLSSSLSANPLFFYLCGIIVGVCASFLVAVYYISKLCPKKLFTYGVMVGGWTVGAFLFQQIWSNLSALALTYSTHLFWYTMVASLLSFMACYRLGPPRDKRTQDLVMWTLQAIGLLLVFFSSSYQEATAAIVIVSLTIMYFPLPLRRAIKAFWLRRFPPKPRVLSNEEYYEEGARETKQSLDKLREYCSSPDCAQWKIMLKLNDSKRSPNVTKTPQSDWRPPSRRFASFVEGDSHLSDNEVLDYETYAFSTVHQPNISSDSSDQYSDDDD